MKLFFATAVSFHLVSCHAWMSSLEPLAFRSGSHRRYASMTTYESYLLTLSSSSSSSAAAGANEVTSHNKKPTIGSIVTIECDLRPQDGWIPDILMDGITLHAHETFRHRLTFCLGDETNGFYPLPGLHQLVRTMEVGDEVEASIDAGWGARNPNLVVMLRKEDLKGRLDTSQLKEGDQLTFEQGRRTCVVTEVTDDTITIDANPPLAGSSYLGSVKLMSVEDAPLHLEYNSNKTGSSISRYEVATFALGCFWGGELAFMRQPGVVGTKVGYTQGTMERPTYEQVCAGITGHTEASQIIYDPDIVSYRTLVQLVMDRLGENKYRLNQVGNDRYVKASHGVCFVSLQLIILSVVFLLTVGRSIDMAFTIIQTHKDNWLKIFLIATVRPV